MTDISQLKKAAFASAAYDTILQVLLRVVSFILNALIVRHVSQAVFAVMSVKLHLLYATGLLLSQEAFRRASLSADLSKKKLSQLINSIWLGAGLSVPIALGECFIWCYLSETPPQDVTKHYSIGVVLVAISVVIEVAAETPFILAELNLWSKMKVIIEGSMQLSRSFFLAIGIVCWPNAAILIYGISHIAGSIIYLFLYYGTFMKYLKRPEKDAKFRLKNFSQLFPSYFIERKEPLFDAELLSVVWSFFKQGWLKWFLTEGELFLMNFFHLISLSQQGVYQVVNNLGSLAARLVFRSIEAAAYKFFAQVVKRGLPVKKQNKAQIDEAAGALSLLLSNLMLISLIMISFGWSYSHLLLWIYGGPSLSESGTILMRAQCFYLVFLSINGITEAFTFAVMDEKQLARHNYVLVGFSLFYLTFAIFLTQYFGAIGFVLANCINMALRISNSLGFIHEIFSETKHNPLQSLIISKSSVACLSLAFVVAFLSEHFIYPSSIVLHLCLGGISLISLVYLLRYELKAPIDKSLSLLDGIIPFRVSSHRSKTAGQKITLISYIHDFLYPPEKLFKKD